MKFIIIFFVALLVLANIFMLTLPESQKAQVLYTNIQYKEDKNLAIAVASEKIIYLGKEEYSYPLIGKKTILKKCVDQCFLYGIDLPIKSIPQIIPTLQKGMAAKFIITTRPLGEIKDLSKIKDYLL